MKKIYFLFALLCAAILMPNVSNAAYNDVTLTTSAVINVGGVNLKVSGSSAVIQSIVVRASDFDVTVLPGSSMTITSSDDKDFGVSGVSTSGYTKTCGTLSSLAFPSPSGTVTVTVSVSGVCVATPTPATPAPSYGSISIPTAPAVVAAPVVTSAPTSPSAGTPFFTRNLQLNQTGSDIRILQQYLNSHGYPVASTGPGSPGHETTYFGTATALALAQFQKAHSLTPTGSLGPQTRALMTTASTPAPAAPSAPASAPAAASSSPSNSFTRDLQLHSTGADVLALQQYLNAHGFVITKSGAGSLGHETTTFGLATYAALAKFQAAHNIPATGYFGPLTRKAIQGSVQ